MGGAERRDDLVDDLLRLLGGEHAVLDEAIRVLLARRALGLDLLDLERLRVGRVVLLVVPEAPVADEVDHEVVAELGPVRSASRTAPSAASGSSALTCTIGMSNPLARSLEYLVERLSVGFVV